MSLRKGSGPHRIAGNVFFVSMLCMSAAGAYMAVMKSQMVNVFGGVLTFYLVATAWVTAKRRDGKPGVFDWTACLVALAVGTGMLTFGFEAANSQTGSKSGIPAGNYFFLGSVALISAAGDVRMLVRGGISGAQRLVRHLWRMCFALFIAAASLFLARPQLFPALLRRTHVLVFLTVLPLLLMTFWMFRVRFANIYRRISVQAKRDVYLLRTGRRVKPVASSQ